MPTVVVDDVVIAAWVQVAILAVLVIGGVSSLRWARRRITRRRSPQDLRQTLVVTGGAVEMVALAAQPDGPQHCAEQLSGESGLSR